MRKRNAFRCWTDWFHAFVGLISVLLTFLPNPLSLSSIFLFLAFIIYQALEAENREESYFDCVEFLAGVSIGLLIRFVLL